MAAVTCQQPAMGPALEFLPYAGQRALALGDSAKRVVMTSRSPSPPPSSSSITVSAASPAPSAGQGPRRIQPTTLNASPHASTSTSERSDVLPKSPALSSVTSISSPSRKGKEREVASAATPNGTNGTNCSANGTPNGTPKKTKALAKVVNGVPKAPGLFPASDINLAWPTAIRTKKAAGLHNGSMACYTNATLQVLLHTPPVLHVTFAHRAAECTLTSRNKFCMLCALRNIATEDHWAGKRRAYNPLPVHKYLGQIKKGFSRNRQEDTHEFFRFVTDALQNTALADEPKDLPEKLKRTTWVYRTWGGQVRSRVLCLSCKHPSDTFDSILDLSLDLPPKARTVQDLLKQFTHEDRLDGDNKYNCEKCKRKSAATKSMRIAEAPPVLTLHLKRFGYSLSWPGRMTKVNNMIEYPGNLDIADYMVDGATEGTKYRLFAVTCHHGSSLNYGHYTSYVRGPEGHWYNADDDDVSQVHAKDVLHDRTAYLLSYMRVQPGDVKTPAATPRAESAALGKRPRESDSPTSNKRASPPATANGVTPKSKANGHLANGKANGPTPALQRLSKQYGSSDEDSKSPLLAPKPRLAAADSPIPRPSAPRPMGSAMSSEKSKNSLLSSPPRSPSKKNKFHTADPKRGLHGVHNKRGAPNPYAVGRKGAKGNNMRTNDKLTKREIATGRRKGQIARMQGRV